MDNEELDRLILDIPFHEESFQELYEKTKTMIFAYIMSMVKNYEDSDDIMQEVYIKVYLAAKNYQSQTKPLAWLYTIAKNECLLHLRRKKINLEYDDCLLLPQDMSGEARLFLEDLLTVLNDQERQVIVMHSLWGLKHYEIANLLQIPLSTSLSSYRRGMKKMKKIGREVQ